MISLPHPYPAGEAERYLDEQKSLREQGLGTAFAIIAKGGRGVCGVVEVREIEPEHSQAELSFWLALEDWGRYEHVALWAIVRSDWALSRKPKSHAAGGDFDR